MAVTYTKITEEEAEYMREKKEAMEAASKLKERIYKKEFERELEAKAEEALIYKSRVDEVFASPFPSSTLASRMHMHMGCLPLATSYIHLAILKSGLNWRMSPAQFHALENLSMETVTTLVKDMVSGEINMYEGLSLLTSKMSEHTLVGLPIIIDKDMIQSAIELRLGDKVIYTL
jgi:hypothetical protein